MAAPLNHPVTHAELTTQCALCLQQVCDIKLIPCGHVLHWACQGANAAVQLTNCPYCRAQITDFYNLNGNTWQYDG
ncbi:MAG TPA: RING-HC finger protein [Mycobacteriales bacterium]|nr:RING-HC finger protein [Mycobacteriales bacterium]